MTSPPPLAASDFVIFGGTCDLPLPTPPAMFPRIPQEQLPAGKPVMLEKPISRNLASVHAISDAVGPAFAESQLVTRTLESA